MMVHAKRSTQSPRKRCRHRMRQVSGWIRASLPMNRDSGISWRLVAESMRSVLWCYWFWLWELSIFGRGRRRGLARTSPGPNKLTARQSDRT